MLIHTHLRLCYLQGKDSVRDCLQINHPALIHLNETSVSQGSTLKIKDGRIWLLFDIYELFVQAGVIAFVMCSVLDSSVVSLKRGAFEAEKKKTHS